MGGPWGAQAFSCRLTPLPSFFARPVPAAKKPGPPSGAVTKGAATPTITRVPAMRVRASPRGQEGPSAPAPPRPLLLHRSPVPGPAAGPHGPEGSRSPEPHRAGRETQAHRQSSLHPKEEMAHCGTAVPTRADFRRPQRPLWSAFPGSGVLTVGLWAQDASALGCPEPGIGHLFLLGLFGAGKEVMNTAQKMQPQSC